MRQLAATDTGRDYRGHAVADLVHVDDVGSVKDGEVNHQAGRGVKFVQLTQRGLVQAILVYRQGTQLDKAHAQFVVPAAAAKPPELDETLEHAVR